MESIAGLTLTHTLTLTATGTKEPSVHLLEWTVKEAERPKEVCVESEPEQNSSTFISKVSFSLIVNSTLLYI